MDADERVAELRSRHHSTWTDEDYEFLANHALTTGELDVADYDRDCVPTNCKRID